jgi:hypothetical protein
MGRYGLNGVSLRIRQGLNAKQKIDLSQIKTSILEDVFNKMPKTDTAFNTKTKAANPDTAVFKELKILYPAIKTFGISNTPMYQTDSNQVDTLKVALVYLKKPLRKDEHIKLEQWLRARYNSPSLKLIML